MDDESTTLGPGNATLEAIDTHTLVVRIKWSSQDTNMALRCYDPPSAGNPAKSRNLAARTNRTKAFRSLYEYQSDTQSQNNMISHDALSPMQASAEPFDSDDTHATDTPQWTLIDTRKCGGYQHLAKLLFFVGRRQREHQWC